MWGVPVSGGCGRTGRVARSIPVRTAIVYRYCDGAATPRELRQNQAAERRRPVKVTGDDGLVQQSIGNAAVGTKEQLGPARRRSGTRGVVLVPIADVVARRAVRSRTAGNN